MTYAMHALMCAVILLASTTAHAQPTPQPVEDETLIYILNRVEVLGESTGDDLHLRALMVRDPAGSVGNASGEVTHTVYIAVSESDLLPNQKVFRLNGLYDPRMKSSEYSSEPSIVISFGPARKRERVAVHAASVDSVDIVPMDNDE